MARPLPLAAPLVLAAPLALAARAVAGADPVAWLRGAARAGRVAELSHPAGLGGFGWLLHAADVPDPLSTRDPLGR